MLPPWEIPCTDDDGVVPAVMEVPQGRNARVAAPFSSTGTLAERHVTPATPVGDVPNARHTSRLSTGEIASWLAGASLAGT